MKKSTKNRRAAKLRRSAKSATTPPAATPKPDKWAGVRFPLVYVRDAGILMHGLVIPALASGYVRELNRTGVSQSFPFGHHAAAWFVAGLAALAALTRRADAGDDWSLRTANAAWSTALTFVTAELNRQDNGGKIDPDLARLVRESAAAHGVIVPLERDDTGPLTPAEVFGDRVPPEPPPLIGEPAEGAAGTGAVASR